MATKKDKRQQGAGLDPCKECGGVECGTGRIVICCTGCTH
jgi:hypothetical protein